ncbi:MAG: hypothetical protein M1828_001325 [Chrysothrix sp. TS-e1954]|nr:MAG: hypothetical protein M1828_001325 [Chrysothrix sp. TS-e1954]
MNQQSGSHVTSRQSQDTPLIVTNHCGATIYPGILSQSGGGPGTGGFALTPGSSKTMTVAENWQGRVWGRTNCSFNSDGTGSSSGTGQACRTGDCGGIIDCQGAGQTPTSLAEFTLDTGSGQTFYDLSLVDGYNLPLAIVMHADQNSTFSAIPPSLTNPSCVGTVGDLAPTSFDPYSNGEFLGTNSSDPLPFDKKVSPEQVARWCPSDLEVDPRTGPSGGVYIYPDGSLDRPQFDPCYSACAKYDQAQYCCTGSYDSPSSCSPSAYTFDDQSSTFIIPAGAGFEVVFCPGGRSTNILGTSKTQLTQLAQEGHVKLKPRQIGNDDYPRLQDIDSDESSFERKDGPKRPEIRTLFDSDPPSAGSSDVPGADADIVRTLEQFDIASSKGSPASAVNRSRTEPPLARPAELARRQSEYRILVIEIDQTIRGTRLSAAGRLPWPSWWFRLGVVASWMFLYA